MRKPRIIHLLLALSTAAFVGCQTAQVSTFEKSLPPCVDGFGWETFPEVNVAIATPKGWHRAVSRAPFAYTGSVSLEDYNTEGLFKTGFTVQVLMDVKKRTGYPPSMLAVAMGQQISEAPENTVLATDSLKENGMARSCLIRYRNSPALGNKITVHKFFVALDQRDWLYIYTFESPNESWDGMFTKYGTPMMAHIVMTQ